MDTINFQGVVCADNAGRKVDGVKPTLAANGGAVVNGTTLTLTFGERLDGSSTPQASAFTVTGGDTSRTVTDVALSGSAVLLTVDPAVEHGETGIRVSYTVPTGTASIPLQDVLGNDADRLSNVPVTNETPDTTSPTVSKLEITSDPGTDRTYAAGDEIRVTVTFSEPVDVERTPRLMLKVGDRNRPAGYLEGTGTTELVFGYEVADGDEDTDGVSIEANRLTLNGGTIRDGSNNNAVLDHDGLAANSGHKVDGASPDLVETGGAVVNGTTLTLTYDEALDGGSRPVSGDFTVSGGDRVRAVTGVRVNGSGVELTLDVGAEHGEAGILVSYTVPTGMGANLIRDVPGNDAEALSRESVTNETPDTTSPEVSILAISSNPGSDRTYAAGDEVEVTVTFSETVEVEGTPQLRLRVGSRTRTAGYLRGTDTAVLVFGYEVADGEEDTDGVSIEAGRIALNGGTIEDEGDNPAELDHEAVAPQAGHKVDGVRPAFLSAAVDGASLTLSYAEALDGGGEARDGGLHGAGGRRRAKRFGSLGQRERSDPDAQPGGGARRYGDPGELHTGDAPDPGYGGQRRSGTEQRVCHQHHRSAQHGSPDHESGIVRSPGKPGAGEAAGGRGHRPGGRGDGLVDCRRGRPVSVLYCFRYGSAEFPDSAGLRGSQRHGQQRSGERSGGQRIRGDGGSEERDRSPAA